MDALTPRLDPTPDFDRIAPSYRLLEYAVFGRALERARVSHLDSLRRCGAVLVLGQGDGRLLPALLAAAPEALVHCIDGSAAMISLARRRAARAGAAGRVTFEQADLRHVVLPSSRYDAIVTQFVLDCFTSGEAAALIANGVTALRPGGLWVDCDFEIPARRWARVPARLSIAVLYAFFRWQTGLTARELPPARTLFGTAGLEQIAVREFRAGLLRSSVFRLPGARDSRLSG
jgi:ubiquinone/menaquinone biosynthesis C-methylase UbiE